jgi:endoglucanase
MQNEHKVKTLTPTAILSLVLTAAIFFAPLTSHATVAAQVWWPTNGAHVTGTQPLKAMVPGVDVSQYDMFWQVDGGTLNRMDSNYTDYQHKEVSISVANWNWRGAGPYTINFVAKKGSSVIAQQSVQIYVYVDQKTNQVQTPSTPVVVATIQPAPTPTTSTQTSTPIATPQPTAAAQVSTSPSSFYVDPNSNAAKQAASWANSNPTGASYMRTLAAQPTASWFGNWNSNIQNDVHTLVAKAQSANATPVLVAYNIPARDCGGYSSGGTSQSNYISWISSFAAGIGSAPAVVILEPDALSNITCLSSGDQNTRLSLLNQAVQILKQNSNTKVYLDAGHSGWVDGNTMAGRLVAANVARADGFSLNVSNFDTTNNETSYGSQISSAVQGKIGQSKHFVIDTGRNGNGSDGNWCNPWGRAIGNKPTSSTGNSLVDAYLWVKTPGESDGYCNGGPSAGAWWASYAQGLVQNAH